MGCGMIYNILKADLKLLCYYFLVGEKNIIHISLVRKVKTR